MLTSLMNFGRALAVLEKMACDNGISLRVTFPASAKIDDLTSGSEISMDIREEGGPSANVTILNDSIIAVNRIKDFKDEYRPRNPELVPKWLTADRHKNLMFKIRLFFTQKQLRESAQPAHDAAMKALQDKCPLIDHKSNKRKAAIADSGLADDVVMSDEEFAKLMKGTSDELNF